VVLVTHKPNILSLVDNIMVMQDGQIALCGARQEVLGRLAEMQRKQREQAERARAVQESLEKRRNEALEQEGGGQEAPSGEAAHA